jgi:membrane protein
MESAVQMLACWRRMNLWHHSSAFSLLCWRRIQEDRLSVLAGHLAYVTLLSLVPLVTVIFSIFSFFPIFASVRLQVEEFVFANFVPAASDIIHHHFSRFVANASRMTSIGVVALVLVALLLISAIDQNLNHIWRSRGQRPKMTTFAVYWMILTLGPLLAGASILATSYVISLRVFHHMQLLSNAAGLMLGVLPFILSFFSLMLIFVMVPNVKIRWRDALAGAAVSALLLEGAKKVFALYITNFTSYQTIYGALAVIPILFVWVYLSWWLVLLGAEFTASLGDYRIRRAPVWD